MKRPIGSWISILVFFISLSLFAAFFFLERSFMTNFDENDHIAIAFFMSKGRLLYQGIFSHHFPLPYYWTYLFTPLWGEASPARAVTVFRLSLLILYLLSFISVFFNYKNSKSRYSFSLWLILLATFFTLYHGNLVLSETFSAIFIVSLFWLYLPVIMGWEKITYLSLLLSVVLASAAFWTQPLLVFLSFIPLILAPAKDKLKIFLSFIFINLIPLAAFYFSGQLSDFVKQGLWFNFAVYPKFYVDIIPDGDKWWGIILYFFQNQVYLLTHFFTGHQIFQFVINLSLIVLLIKSVLAKKPTYIISFLLIFLAVHIREVKIIPGSPFNFGIYPLILISSSAFALLFVSFLPKHKLLVPAIALILLSVSVNNSYLIIKNSLDRQYNYHVFWSPRQNTGQLIAKLTRPDENVLVYPHDVDLYYFASRLPSDRFVYWFPWIDSVPEFRDQRLASLASDPPSVIYLGNLDFKGQKNYYAQYFPDLTHNYTEIMKDQKHTGVWLRSDLKDRL